MDKLDVVKAPAARAVPVFAIAPVVFETTTGKTADFASAMPSPRARAINAADPILG